MAKAPVLGKPSILSIGAWIALVAICIYLIYAATHKSDNETFTKGASKNESTTTLSPTANYYPFSFGCAPIMRLQDFKVPEAEKDNPILKKKK